MLAENMDEELSNFDLKHFCDGNPIYCYYFRLPALQAAAKPSGPETLVEKLLKEMPLPTTLVKDTPLKIGKYPWQE